MHFKTKLKPALNLIDLTPLVDVIFLLLIFFSLTSEILPLKSLHIEVPKIAQDTLPLTTQLMVVVDAHHVIYVGSKKTIVELSGLKDVLKKEVAFLPQKKANIVLNIDQKVDYGFFLKIYTIAQECCPQIRLVYQSSNSPS